MEQTEKIKVTVTVEKTETGFSASADHRYIVATGDTMQQLKSNFTEACKVYFDEGEKFEVKWK